MPSSVINSDDGVISGTSGIKTTGGDDGVLVFQSKGTETARINTDSQIVAAAGTVSAPVYSTTGDTNTGIFFPAADTIAFAEGGAEAMRINSSGNVFIGAASSALGERLGAYGGGTTYAIVGSTTNTVNSYIGADGANSLVFLGSLSNHPVAFRTNNTERMRIDSSGNLLLNTTSTVATTWFSLVGASSSKNGIGIKNASDSGTIFSLFIRNAADVTIGSINNNGSTTSFSTSSDYRLKHDIQPMTGALAKVQQLKPVTYKWNADDSQSQGFIAHELQSVCPEAVTGEKDAVDTDGNPQYQGVDTSFLVATLTAAIQELKAELDEAKARIAALEQA
jgi:hypothetical protein